jgi:hypothetical protein
MKRSQAAAALDERVRQVPEPRLEDVEEHTLFRDLKWIRVFDSLPSETRVQPAVLPTCALEAAFTFLDAQSLGRASAVCAHWTAISSANAMWEGVIAQSPALLGKACERSDVRLVEMLLEWGADANGYTGQGYTPLIATILAHKRALVILDDFVEPDSDQPECAVPMTADSTVWEREAVHFDTATRAVKATHPCVMIVRRLLMAGADVCVCSRAGGESQGLSILTAVLGLPGKPPTEWQDHVGPCKRACDALKVRCVTAQCVPGPGGECDNDAAFETRTSCLAPL